MGSLACGPHSSPRSCAASQPFCSHFRSLVVSAAPCCPHRTLLTPKRRCSHCLFPASPDRGRQFLFWIPSLKRLFSLVRSLSQPRPHPTSACASPSLAVSPLPGVPALLASLLVLCLCLLCSLRDRSCPAPALCLSPPLKLSNFTLGGVAPCLPHLLWKMAVQWLLS